MLVGREEQQGDTMQALDAAVRVTYLCRHFFPRIKLSLVRDREIAVAEYLSEDLPLRVLRSHALEALLNVDLDSDAPAVSIDEHVCELVQLCNVVG